MPSPQLTRQFRPSLSGSLITLIGLVFLCSLGFWQVSRFQQKQALWTAFARGSDALIALPRAATPPARYGHVQVSGRFLSERQFLLDSMTHGSESGYRVLVPLETDLGPTVLVDRGWVPRRSTGKTPDLTLTTEVVHLTGRMDLLPSRGINLPDTVSHDWPRLMNDPRMDALERALGRPLYPQILLLDPHAPDGFIRDWHAPGLPPEQHLGYAVTWFTCALTLLGLYIYRSRRVVTLS